MRLLKSIAYAVFCSVLLTSAGCRPAGSLPAETFSDINYTPDKENTLDITLPEGRTEKTPVIILIHGGAWTGGDKKDFSFMRGFLSERGFASVSVNYRLAKVKGKGIWDILDDIDLAVSFIREKRTSWTYSGNSIFLLGHSAGGHISLLYSFTRAKEGIVRGAVSYCGLTDLTASDLQLFLKQMHLRENPGTDSSFDRIGFVAGNEREKRIAASPLYNLRDIPVLLVCGKMDDIIPWSQSEKLHKKMKETGLDSTLLVYPDMGHDITPHYGEIMKKTEQWLLDRI